MKNLNSLHIRGFENYESLLVPKNIPNSVFFLFREFPFLQEIQTTTTLYVDFMLSSHHKHWIDLIFTSLAHIATLSEGMSFSGLSFATHSHDDASQRHECKLGGSCCVFFLFSRGKRIRNVNRICFTSFSFPFKKIHFSNESTEPSALIKITVKAPMPFGGSKRRNEKKQLKKIH